MPEDLNERKSACRYIDTLQTPSSYKAGGILWRRSWGRSRISGGQGTLLLLACVKDTFRFQLRGGNELQLYPIVRGVENSRWRCWKMAEMTDLERAQDYVGNPGAMFDVVGQLQLELLLQNGCREDFACARNRLRMPARRRADHAISAAGPVRRDRTQYLVDRRCAARTSRRRSPDPRKAAGISGYRRLRCIANRPLIQFCNLALDPFSRRGVATPLVSAEYVETAGAWRRDRRFHSFPRRAKLSGGGFAPSHTGSIPGFPITLSKPWSATPASAVWWRSGSATTRSFSPRARRRIFTIGSGLSECEIRGKLMPDVDKTAS